MDCSLAAGGEGGIGKSGDLRRSMQRGKEGSGETRRCPSSTELTSGKSWGLKDSCPGNNRSLHGVLKKMGKDTKERMTAV